MYAPGVKVQSVGIKSTTSTNTLSGTSMASPHIAGLAAYIMGLNNVTNIDDVATMITALASSNNNATVKNNAQGTTNLIANNGFRV